MHYKFTSKLIGLRRLDMEGDFVTEIYVYLQCHVLKIPVQIVVYNSILEFILCNLHCNVSVLTFMLPFSGVIPLCKGYL
uniref:Predicted protein n=1 Tax=Hordeum vulgare subsp. vulgare TaxID=112509 RepID=F2DJX3_HORVV|nr:predicted protein [Hordeum vulgare subsp. vulgare]